MNMSKAIIVGFICGLVVNCLVGCTAQQNAKHWGGIATEDLPPGQKLIGATWEQDNLWYVTRPFHAGEKPETITLIESSSYGLFQGKIVVHEQVEH